MSDEETGNVVEFCRKPAHEGKRTKSARPRTYEELVASIVAETRALGLSAQSFKPMQRVICKIEIIEQHACRVSVLPHGLPGYMPSRTAHNIGEQIMATVIGVHANQLFLSDPGDWAGRFINDGDTTTREDDD